MRLVSPVRDTTKELEQFLNDNKLNESYGVISSKKPEYQELTFCKGNIDGTVRVYTASHITVDYQILGKGFVVQSTLNNVMATKEYLLERIRG